MSHTGEDKLGGCGRTRGEMLGGLTRGSGRGLVRKEQLRILKKPKQEKFQGRTVNSVR